MGILFMESSTSNRKGLEWAVFAASVLFSITYIIISIGGALEFDKTTALITIIGMFAVALVSIVIILIHHKINRMHDPMEERIGSVGSRYALFALVYSIIPVMIELLGAMLIPDFYDLYDSQPARLSFAITIITLYIIGFPVLLLSLRKIPKMKICPHKMGFGVFCVCITMTAGLALAGSLIGTPIHLLLTSPFEQSDSVDISKILLSSSLLERILIVGIIGPAFEELMFRKILIDRTIRYGQTLSVLLSGVMFGLFHGNFQQFFFATLLGMLFAMVYIKTGRIRYPMMLHMLVNLSTSIITASLVNVILPYMDKDFKTYPTDVVMAYFVFILWMLFLFRLAVV